VWNRYRYIDKNVVRICVEWWLVMAGWPYCVICIRTKALLYYFCLRCRNSFVFFRNENGEGYELLQDMTSFRQAKNRPESDA